MANKNSNQEQILKVPFNKFSSGIRDLLGQVKNGITLEVTYNDATIAVLKYNPHQGSYPSANQTSYSEVTTAQNLMAMRRQFQQSGQEKDLRVHLRKNPKDSFTLSFVPTK